jgi:hypothetical protein
MEGMSVTDLLKLAYVASYSDIDLPGKPVDSPAISARKLQSDVVGY